MSRRRRRGSDPGPWDRVIGCLLLVKLGQSLGTGGPLAEAVCRLVDGLLAVVR